MAQARASLERYAAKCATSHLTAELGEIQPQFCENGQLLLEVITEVDANYAEIAARPVALPYTRSSLSITSAPIERRSICNSAD